MLTEPIPLKQQKHPDHWAPDISSHCATNGPALRQTQSLTYMPPILSDSLKSDPSFEVRTMQQLPPMIEYDKDMGNLSALCRPSFEAFWVACAGPR